MKFSNCEDFTPYAIEIETREEHDILRRLVDDLRYRYVANDPVVTAFIIDFNRGVRGER